MTTELTKAAQQGLEALKHGVAQLNGIGIPLEADPLHSAIAALQSALTQRPAAHDDFTHVGYNNRRAQGTIDAPRQACRRASQTCSMKWSAS